MHDDTPRLARNDIPEVRPKCNDCGFELTYIEYLLLDGKCVFHAKDLSRLEVMSRISYVRLLLDDLDVARGKLRMKLCGKTGVDYQACVNTGAEDLHKIKDHKGLKNLIDTMRKHKGEWSPI